MLARQVTRATRPLVASKFSCQRWMSSAAADELPTRHSLNQPPRVCSDPVELQEETKKLLETPVGQLYASRATASGGMEEAYDLAFTAIKRAEYLQFGYASQIPGSLYAPDDGSSAAAKSSEDPISSGMLPLLNRMKQEGEMYMKLRYEKRMVEGKKPNDFMPGSAKAGFNTDEEGYLPSSDDSESSDDSSSSDEDNDEDADLSDDSSSSDEDSDEEDADAVGPMPGGSRKVPFDFAPPGPTAKMQEAILDVMSCVGEASPNEYYETALQIFDANDLDKGSNSYTLPSHVTYNASLRGIAKCDLSDDMVRDEALSSSFSLYNHLTHSLHLPRNTMTIVYMLQVVDKAIPASRVKGNISVTLWDHAIRLGVVNAQVVEAMKNIHDPTNGPEFDIFLEEISGNLLQKDRRFVNKYKHSNHY
jgi:hypothetical protein